jgi:hypothetical protein
VLTAGALWAAGCGDSTGPSIPSRLAFILEPVSVGAGSPLTPALVVAVTDDDGRIVESWSDSVALSLEGETSGAELLGTTTKAPVAGVAVFDDLRIEASGVDYRLVARSGSLPATSSQPFAVHDAFSSSVVTAGYEHTCALKSDGTAYCWGDNEYGQLGDGTQDSRSLPTPVVTALRFTSILAGGWHSCGLTADGVAYCWGANSYGQVGDGTTDNSPTPLQVALGSTIVALTAGYEHTCALKSDGTAYCWGRNDGGQLGDGTETDRSTPTPIAGDLALTAISAGFQQTCGLTAGGAAYCWGGNLYAEVGDSTRDTRSSPTPVVGNHEFSSVTAGGGPCHGHSCGVATDGSTYCWGHNYQTPGLDKWLLAPTALAGDPGFLRVTVGGAAVCGIGTSGTLYCWGTGTYGQVGSGTTAPVRLPTPIMQDRSFISASSGQDHTCAVTSDGATYCWGRNTSGQLGNESNPIGWTIPVPVWEP